jgi:uracil-DNA glycosylase family 4
MKKDLFGFDLDYEEINATGELNKFLGCKQCKLDKNCLSPHMPMSGKGKKGILFIAEAPGRTEDEKGTQLLFRKLLQKIDIDLDEDCFKTNALACRPPGNATPTDTQIKCCRAHVLQAIEETKPKVIGLLGMPAIKSVIGNVWTEDIGSVGMWRGWAIPDRYFKTWLMPTYHPSFIKRHMDAFQGKENIATKLFIEDLARIYRYTTVNPTVCWDDEDSKIKILSESEAKEYLVNILPNPPEWMAFDYETTGLKPFRKGHEIFCVSMYDGKFSRVFLLTKTLWKPFISFLKSNIKKIACNMKFEEVWSRQILNTAVNAWAWDTMQNAHILDNRGGDTGKGFIEKGITSVLFQSYIRYGRCDFKKETQKYLTAGNEFGANTFNRIKEAPEREVLLRCALDSLLEYKIAMDQMKEMNLESVI